MISFKVEGSRIKITTEANINWTFNSFIETGSEAYAILLKNSFEEKLRNELEKTRKDAYEAGYKDKTKRRPKQTWFPNWFGARMNN